MKFMLFVLPTVPGTLEDRKRLRPIGRNNERYQQMLDELRQLAVFAEPVRLSTVEHLAGGSVGTLATLVDRSLVEAEVTEAGTRYRLPGPVRGYALRRIAQAGEEPVMRDRHLAWVREAVAADPAGLDDLARAARDRGAACARSPRRSSSSRRATTCS
jgi:predicted ATPase